VGVVSGQRHDAATPSQRPLFPRVKFSAMPMSRDEANAFVGIVHRHAGQVVAHRFAIGALVDGRLVGTAVVGNTKARGLHDRYAAEVVRLATDGTFNACSFLYGRCRRSWIAMGGDPRKLVTYTLVTEPGTSLEAAGYVRVARVKGKEHDTPSRRRRIKGGTQLVDKWRWQAAA
jgi:hypothetical protein